MCQDGKPAAGARRLTDLSRHYLRKLLYSVRADRILGKWLPKPVHERDPKAYWDKALAGPFHTYLGGTTATVMQNAILTGLLAQYAPDAKVFVDVGCAAGELSRALTGTTVRHYIGVDVSEYAVRQAIQQRSARPDRFVATSAFEVADLCRYQLPDGVRPDVIAFNEVLYYLSPEEAGAQVVRYLQMGHERAIAIVSMKNDAKSSCIFSRLSRMARWINGVVWQEQPCGYSFRIRINRERPAYLTGVFRLCE